MYAQVETLEKRRLLSTVPFPAGKVASTSSLWSVNGNGTGLVQLLKNFASGASGGSGYQAATFNGAVYLRVFNSLWKTDGTPQGTQRVAGLGTSSSMVTWMGVVGQTLYYTELHYDNSEHETYGYLRSTSGTVPVQYGAIYPRIVDGKLYVEVERYLPLRHTYWEVNGTIATQIATPIGAATSGSSGPVDSVMINGKQIYAHDDGVHGNELWLDDGSGKHLAQDIFPGSGSSEPNHLYALHDKVIFFASTPAIPSYSAAISDGILMVNGGDGNDQINISSDGQQTTVTLMNPTWPNVLQSAFDNDEFTQLSINGGAGNDKIDASGVSDPVSFFGEAGDDTIITGGGDDTVDGGDGNDTLDYSGHSEGLSVAWARVTTAAGVDSFHAVETLLCGSGDDDVNIQSYYSSQNGNSQALRYIDGGPGNDTLVYFDQADDGLSVPATVHGGDGNDTLSVDRDGHYLGLTPTSGGFAYYFGDAGDDTFIMHRSFANRDFNGGSGTDSVDYREFSTAGGLYISLDDKPGDGPHGMDNVHSDVEIVYGSVFDDTIIGTSHDDTIVGYTGHDLLIGNGGNDSIVSDQYDTVLEFAPADPPAPASSEPASPPFSLLGGVLTLTGSSAFDQFYVAPRSDDPSRIVASIGIPGVKHIYSLSQVKSIVIQAGDGADRVFLNKVSIPCVIFAGDGNDTVWGSQGLDRIVGGEGDDWINGGAGNDVIYGGAGNDRLFGGGGKDYISGGTGVNVLRGGGGIDRIFGLKSIDDYRGNRGDIVKLVLG
jgi:ELWxxDGT repeat protein